MKPAVCEVCGTRAWELPAGLQGSSVLFLDYSDDALITIGHPVGLEYFCGHHLQAAQALSHMPAFEAIAKLRLDTGLSPPLPVPMEMPKSFFRRLLNMFE